MSKLKGVVLVLVVAVLVDFALENSQPVGIKLFKFDLGKPAVFLLTYGTLALGLLVGWLGHVRRARKKSLAAQEQALLDEKPDTQHHRETTYY